MGQRQSTVDFERLAALAQTALAHMSLHQIEPTPENYTVWYGYCADRVPALKRAIEILVSNRQEFTPDICSDLYERFYGGHRQTEKIRLVTQQIESVVARAMGTLSTAGADAKHFTEALGHSAVTLAGETELGRVRSALREIMDETQDMINRSETLERQLNKSTEEIGQLRKQVEDASREAMTDGLTGIGNRKMFDFRLKQFMQESMENGNDLCLLLLDIDHFKKFNDTYGHQFGDLVLRLVGNVLVDSIKGRDQATRYGGEEFAILLPDTRLVDARTVAENLRINIANKAIVKRDTKEQLGVVTISIGVSCYRLGEPPYVLIERADTALYRAKQTGRNRVVTESELDPVPAKAAPTISGEG